MPTQWYYRKGEQQHGPVTAERLNELASAGDVGPSDLVWAEGMTEWRAAGQVDGLAGLIRRTTPPPTPARFGGVVPPPAPPNAAARPSSAPPLPAGPLARPTTASPEPAITPPSDPQAGLRKPPKELAAVRSHETFDEAAQAVLAAFRVPQTLLGVLVAVPLNLVAVLASVGSLAATGPLLALTGIWIVIVSIRVRFSLHAGVILGSFSEVGRISAMLTTNGVALAFLLLLSVPSIAGGYGYDWIVMARLLMVVYTIIVLPLTGYTWVRVRQVVSRPKQ